MIQSRHKEMAYTVVAAVAGACSWAPSSCCYGSHGRGSITASHRFIRPSTCAPSQCGVRHSHGQKGRQNKTHRTGYIRAANLEEEVRGPSDTQAEAGEEQQAAGTAQSEAVVRTAPAGKESDTQLGFVRSVKTGKGAAMARLLRLLDGLLDRPYGGGQSIAGAGGAVIERVVEDLRALQSDEDVNQQAVFEMLRVLQLLERNLELVNAARKEETLVERLQASKVICQQAVLVADSL